MATIPPINPINLETFLGAPARIPGGLENGNVLPAYMNGPAFTPRSQQQASIEALNRALTGDLSASLSGGDRLLALAALMRSATRSGQRAGLTPQQVIGDLRQQQVQQAQARLQIEQLRAAEAQQQRSSQLRQQLIASLPEESRRYASLLGDAALESFAADRLKGRELTEAERALIAARISPDSPEGQQILRDVAASKGIITVTGPAGTTYIRGSRAAATTVNTTAEYEALPVGTQYVGPDGVLRTKGGQTGGNAPSGQFR